MLVWGGGAGLFNALLTLLPQIVCPYGYSDVSAEYLRCSSLSIMCSVCVYVCIDRCRFMGSIDDILWVGRSYNGWCFHRLH